MIDTRTESDIDGPLRGAQLNIWLEHALNPDSGAHNMANHLVVDDFEQPELFDRAWRHLVAHSRELRSVFFLKDGTPWRGVRPVEHPEILVTALADASDAAMVDAVDRLRAIPLDLEQGPVFRAGRIDLGGNRWCLHYTIHHICADAAAAQLIWEVLTTLINGWIKEPNWTPGTLFEEPPMVPVRADSEAFFLRRLQAFEGVPTLSSHPGEPGVIDEPGSVECVFDRPLYGHIVDFSRTHGGSVLAPFAVALGVYIARTTRSEGATIGYPVAGRSRRSRFLGMMTNTLPLIVQYDVTQPFSTLVVDAAREIRATLRHQQYPTHALRQIHRRHADGAMFSALFSLQNFQQVVALGEQRCRAHTLTSGPAEQINFQLFDFGDAGDLRLRAQFNRALFSPPDAQRHFEGFVRTLGALLGSPERRLGELVFDAESVESVLARSAGEAVEEDGSASVLTWFESSVARAPESIALCGACGEWSYGALDVPANRMARGVVPWCDAGVVGGGGVAARSVEHSRCLGSEGGCAWLSVDPVAAGACASGA